ncbi:helix-turn-helix transcriptional regulator [Streptomyces sp. NPDC001617]
MRPRGGRVPSVAARPARLAGRPQHLTRVFGAETGLTVVSYIRHRRLQRARHLLLSSALSVTAIAAAVGIADLQAFNKACRRELGASPRDVRAAVPRWLLPRGGGHATSRDRWSDRRRSWASSSRTERRLTWVFTRRAPFALPRLPPGQSLWMDSQGRLASEPRTAGAGLRSNRRRTTVGTKGHRPRDGRSCSAPAGCARSG